MAEGHHGDNKLTDREIEFIAARDGFFLGTVSESGWPYVQYRGGPAGFVKVLDHHTLAFADFRGNMQMLSTGNIGHASRTSLFFVDDANRRRLKLFANARVLDDDDARAFFERTVDREYPALPERVIVLEVVAYDWNCPQHITPRFTEAEFAARGGNRLTT